MRNTPTVLAMLGLVAACAGSATQVVSPAHAPSARAEAFPEAAPPAETEPSPPSCAPLEAAGPPPSILVATWPETPRRRRDARGRRIIVLDDIDGYGPLVVARIDPPGHPGEAGTATDLGEGTDPRFYDGAILYRDGRTEPSTTVRVAADGTTERLEGGGTGVRPGLGGPTPFWRSPFTRDGRFMAFAEGCLDGDHCVLLLYDHFPASVEGDAPLASYELGMRAPPNEVLLTEDANVLAACTREGASEAVVLLWVDRRSGEPRTLPIGGRCLGLSPTGDRVLFSDYESERIELIAPATDERTRVEVGLHVSGAAFDRCGASVVLVGAVTDTEIQRGMRIFFDGRPPLVLFETTGGPELLTVEVDDRGWVLFASDDPREPAHVLVVSLGGGAPTEWTVPGRVYDAALGP